MLVLVGAIAFGTLFGFACLLAFLACLRGNCSPSAQRVFARCCCLKPKRSFARIWTTNKSNISGNSLDIGNSLHAKQCAAAAHVSSPEAAASAPIEDIQLPKIQMSIFEKELERKSGDRKDDGERVVIDVKCPDKSPIYSPQRNDEQDPGVSVGGSVSHWTSTCHDPSEACENPESSNANPERGFQVQLCDVK